MPHTATVDPLRGQSAEVDAFLREFPAVAAALSQMKRLVAGEFDAPAVQFHVLASDTAEAPDPLLCLLVQHRENAEDARRIRRALLNGPWLELPAEVLGRVALQLKARAE